MNRHKTSQRLILASQSARRITLLSALGIPFRILRVDFRERFFSASPEEVARLIAWEKAEQARRLVKSGLLLTADTMVALDGKLFGKPRTKREACSMLARLSGRTHQVTTAMVLMDLRTGCAMIGSQNSLVDIRRLTRGEIRGYVQTGESMDKAGAYGIQGLGGKLVSRIRGEYYNVVGFPVALFCALAGRFGLKIPRKNLRQLLSSRLKFT